jgi:ParB-like chromosome segregation protein Spo0J
MTDGQFLSLKRAIRKEGFCGVILVNKAPTGMVIVDGEHRWRAARALGMEDAPCVIGEFSEERARALTVKMNQIHGYWSAPELVDLLDTLSDSLEDLGFSEQEFAKELERALATAGMCEKMNEVESGKCPDSRRYTGFSLSSKQERLLERALTQATRTEKGGRVSRAKALEKVVRSYLKGV